MRLTRRTVCTLLGVLMFLTMFVMVSGPVFATTFSSTNTSTSVGTPVGNAITLSGRAYPSGAPVAVVANADDWSKVAGASVLARAYGGPLLLSSSSSLSTSVTAEIRRLGAATVYVVGLSTTVAAQLDAALAGISPRPQVITLTGADAVETAALVARQVKVKLGSVDRVVIVPTNDSAGVLAASAMAAANGWPILLTPAAGPFPQASADAIAELGATAGICVGTTVNPGVSGFSVEKTLTGTVSGSDPDGRFTLCARTAEYAVSQGYSSYSRLGLTEAYDRAMGQVMSAYVAGSDGVLLLSASSGLPTATQVFMQTHGRDISEVHTVSLSWAIVRQIKSLNSPRITAVTPSSGPVAGGTKVVVTGTGLDTASAVTIGKTTVPAGDWRVDSSTQLTILSTPLAPGSGPAEVIVQNYWNRSPASVKDLFRYADGGAALPGDRVVTEALKYLGTPYVWAGASPAGGFDCSGLTMYVYKQLGVTLPHYSRAQAGYGTAVSKDALLPGDLVFFSNPISHVGIYVGGGLMINAPRSGDLVTIENVYRSSFVAARRIFSPYTRYQDNNALVGIAGGWLTSGSSAASGGSFRWLNSPGLLTVKFNGAYLGWIGEMAPHYGKALVTVDGGPPIAVDLYSSTAKSQQSIWNTGILSAGEHTVTIEWTGTKNASATGYNVNADAFDLIGSMVQPAAHTRFQENDAHLAYSGIWLRLYTWSASGGSFAYANATSRVTVSFDGTYLAWVAKKGPQYGQAKVALDGGTAVSVDLYSASAVYKRGVYSTGILPKGPHTVTIEWTGSKSPLASGTIVDVDTFDVVGALTNVVGTPPAATTTRYEQNDSRIGYVGSWSTTTDPANSAGDGTYANSAAKMVVSFKGTSLSWVAKKSSVYGIAEVTLDDKAPVQVDLYSPTQLFQQSVYQTGVLPDGDHTLTIAWTGAKNAAATDYNVGADAFDIAGQLTQSSSIKRYEENASGIAYAGTWQPNSWGLLSSGGRSVYTNTPGSSVTISFDGTYIAWLTKKSPLYGKAMVSLDGAAPVTVDLFSSTEVFQQRIWNSGILPAGPHTLTIQWSWGRNRYATDTNICLDAVEVEGTLTPATATVLKSQPKVVVIDPGHQLYANNALEPVGPGSTTMKAKVSAGTASVNTGSPESALVLQVGLKLRDLLRSRGIDVVMTRETQDVNISNAERAQLANEAGADLFVRIHADGATDPAVNGILMLYPATITGWTDDISSDSLRAATIALQEMVKETGAKNRGLSARSDIAGFNWSDVPVFLPEIGLMTNPVEDAKLATDAYQDKLVVALARSILCFLDFY